MSRSGLAPARLAPIFVPRVWGTCDLSPLFPDHSQEEEAIGEVWLTGNACEFATGEFRERALGDVWPSLPAEWTGTALRGLPQIPLLVKFLFPEDKLSVQVHPCGDNGKTEMWYVMSATEDAAVRVGFVPGVTRESFERAVASKTTEQGLRKIPVRAGEAVYVPCGTPHAIYPGMVLCEIQQHSDITYRIFDYDRPGADGKPRELHIRQAFEVLRFGEAADPGAGRCAAAHAPTSGTAKTFYAACRYFATERWEFRDHVSAVTSLERFELLIFLEGRGRIEFAGGSEPFARGEAWLLPAALGAYKLTAEAPTSVLHTYVPDIGLVATYLKEHYNLSEADCSRLIHR